MYICVVQRIAQSAKEEAQLPQRNSASAAHVYLGWLDISSSCYTLNYTVSQKKCTNFETV